MKPTSKNSVLKLGNGIYLIDSSNDYSKGIMRGVKFKIMYMYDHNIDLWKPKMIHRATIETKSVYKSYMKTLRSPPKN